MDPTTADFNAWLAEEGAKIGATVPPQPTSLLAMYGTGYAPSDSHDQSTADVLSRMQGGTAVGNLLRSLAPEVRQADDSTAATGILSRLARTGTGMVHSGLNTTANWLEKRPEIGPDTLAPPLGLAPMGMALTPRSAVGVFGGRLAQTADHAALARAEDMAKRGASRDQIYKDTGWFQGTDGKWRFEIDDSMAEYVGGVGNAKRFDQFVDHPELMAAYPQMGGAKARELTKGEAAMANAGYDPDKKEFIFKKAAFDDDAKGSALHEAQHYVQELEGFAPGSNLKLAAKDALREFPEYRAADDAAKAAEASGPKGWNRLNPFAWGSHDNRMDKAWRAEEAARRTYQRKVDTGDVMDAYRRSAGEVEARNVQDRLYMDADERRSLAPWKTQDTPDRRQIVNLLSDQSRASVPGTVINSLDADRTLYHGTPTPGFSQFDLNKVGSATDPGMLGHGVSLSFNPANASRYAVEGNPTTLGKGPEGMLTVGGKPFDHSRPDNSAAYLLVTKQMDRQAAIEGAERAAGEASSSRQRKHWQDTAKVLREFSEAETDAVPRVGAVIPAHASGRLLEIDYLPKSREEALAIQAKAESEGYSGINWKAADEVLMFKRGSLRSATTGDILFSRNDTGSVPGTVVNAQEDYGQRNDGTAKGKGFLGELKRPGGGVSTEISVGVNIGGKEMEIPLLVPTLSKQEIRFLLENDPAPGDIPESIMQKAYDHAVGRVGNGLSPFAD